MYLVLWVALLPRSECQSKPQPPRSIPKGAKSPQVQPVPLTPKSPWSLWLGPPFTLQSSSQRRLNINHNVVGRMGRKTKAFLAVHSTPQEPFMQLAYTGTFCTASYFCKPSNIFKHAGGGDFMEEVCVESFCNTKIVLLFKKSFLI